MFFEPTVNGPFVAPGFSDDPHLVFAPHNYAESIGPDVPGLLPLLTDALQLLAGLYRTTTWIGEYGNFSSDPQARADYMARFNRLDDRNPGAGGTWWQWEQQCGDPHDVAGAYPPDADWVARQAATCGESARMDTPCTARSYPRAMPGRLESLRAEPCGGAVTVAGRRRRREHRRAVVPRSSVRPRPRCRAPASGPAPSSNGAAATASPSGSDPVRTASRSTESGRTAPRVVVARYTPHRSALADRRGLIAAERVLPHVVELRAARAKNSTRGATAAGTSRSNT